MLTPVTEAVTSAASPYSLEGKVALVVGIANQHSIAWGCARAFRDQGAQVAVTYLNDKAVPYVKPLADEIEAPLFLPLDVAQDEQLDAVFAEVEKKFGKLDILLHSIAFCPKDDLHGRVVDSSREGFSLAMDISVHSFIRMVRRAEPLMQDGGTCLTVTYYGAEKVVENYNIMGPVKAALESTTRYLAAELGPKGITVHALSPGPMRTRAASGIAHFDELLDRAAERAPTHMLATLEQVGGYATFLAGPAARNTTGGVHHIDGGYHIVG